MVTVSEIFCRMAQQNVCELFIMKRLKQRLYFKEWEKRSFRYNKGKYNVEITYKHVTSETKK